MLCFVSSLFLFSRCTCTQALKVDYFSNFPPPTPGQNLPIPRSRKVIDEEIGKEIRTARKKATDDSSSEVVKKLYFD